MKKFIYKTGLVVVFVLLLIYVPLKSYAHCEIPCGIYADSVRVTLIAEHIETIEKSMKMIEKLSAEEKLNYNQLTRWIANKEEHAKKIQEIATQYFMFQRIKLTDNPEEMAKNQKMLDLLHRICVLAMKSKQSTDLLYVTKMREALSEFSQRYFKTGHHH